MFLVEVRCVIFFCLSSIRRQTRCALVTGVQTCALPISSGLAADDLAPDFDWLVNREIETKPKVDEKSIGGTHIFWASKRAVDIGSAQIGRASCRERMC